MAAKISYLKRQRRRRKFALPNISVKIPFEIENLSYLDEDTDLNLSQDEDKEEADVDDCWQKISELDSLLSEKDSLYQLVKEERKLVQDQMCNIIQDSEISPAHSKKSQLFLHLCNFENLCAEEEEKDQIENKSSDPQLKKQKKTGKPQKDFVTRNIELAKQNSMAQFSLTDEEKIKLENLLSDIDSEEYSMEFEKTTNSEVKDPQNGCECKIDEENRELATNYFKLREDDLSNLKDLELKLGEILDSYDDNERDYKLKQVLQNAEEGDILENAEREGRLWRHFHLQQRLEIIEKNLADIAVKDAEEQKEKDKNSEDDRSSNKEDELEKE